MSPRIKLFFDFNSLTVRALLAICALGAIPTVLSAERIAISIVRPQHGETIHDNAGNVPIAASLQGTSFSPDKRLRVLLDCKPLGVEQRTLEFTLQGIERGEHAVQLQLLDKQGALLATSLTTTFYLWQASSLFPARKPGSTPPK